MNKGIEAPMGFIKKFWGEFKSFAFKGNMIDLAVAVVIGAAFGKVITALVNDIIMPLVTLIVHFFTEHASAVPGGNKLSDYGDWKVGPFPIGNLLSEMLNFLIVALAVFVVIVKVMGTLVSKVAPPPPGEPTTKECPLCLSIIPIKARRCAQCTADLTSPEATAAATQQV